METTLAGSTVISPPNFFVRSMVSVNQDKKANQDLNEALKNKTKETKNGRVSSPVEVNDLKWGLRYFSRPIRSRSLGKVAVAEYLVQNTEEE